MWNSEDPDFAETQVNEKWKNQSAVILAKRFELEELHTNSMHVYENLYVHQRIKLHDKAAVDEYSEITFNENQIFTNPAAYIIDNDVFVGIKVIKPNGTEKEVPVTEAVAMEIKAGLKKQQYKKLAVPDLEPGDILDYFVAQESKTLIVNRSSLAMMTPIKYTLQGTRPIQRQSIKVSMTKQFSFNHKSVNGAPELKREFDPKTTKIIYNLYDKDREPVKDVRWIYNYRELPTVKFQALYTQKPSGKGLAALGGGPGTSRSGFSEADLLRFLQLYAPKSNLQNRFISVYLSGYMMQKFGREKNPEVLAREAYYFIRQFLFVEALSKAGMHNLGPESYINDWNFTSVLSAYLKKKKIDHDVLVTSRSYISDFSDAVLPFELDMIIRLNTPTPIYIANPTRTSLFGEIPYELQGCNALAMNVLAKPKEAKLVPVTIPKTTHQQNTDHTALHVTFDNTDNFKNKVSRHITYTGLNRLDETRSLMISEEYIAQSRRPQYKTNISASDRVRGTYMKDVEEKLQQRFTEEEEWREKAMKTYMEELLKVKVLSVDTMAIDQVGAWENEKEMKFRDSYTVEGLVTQAGPNLLLNTGVLTGYQIELKKEEMDRKFPVHVAHPCTFNHTVTVDIPEGYEVKGLEKLNYYVANKTGGFISKATIKGNELTINTTKYYADYLVTVQDWPLMVDFLEAAYDFSQQKVLLQKQRLTSN